MQLDYKKSVLEDVMLETGRELPTIKQWNTLMQYLKDNPVQCRAFIENFISYHTAAFLEYLDLLIADISIEPATVPDTLTNSQITAECIKAGITDPEDIAWVQYNAGDVPKLEKVTAQELIQYLLEKKKQ